MRVVYLNIFNQSVELKTVDGPPAKILSAIYAPFIRIRPPAAVHPNGSIEISATGASLNRSVTHGNKVTQCETMAQVLYTIDKIITIELQFRRPDLFFVHAAAFSTGTNAILVVGEPGAGKSTLCWSLCDAGCRYLSDELAPVILEETKVQPFPRAISLKSLPDALPPLPTASIDAGATMHIPADSLPGGYEMMPLPIASIVFLLPESDVETPSLLEMPAAEAAARLYANGLNQLAHEGEGLKAAANLAAKVRGVAVRRTRLSDMTAMMMDLAEQEHIP